MSILDFAMTQGTLRIRLRPDILDFFLHEAYEIKPRSRAVEGVWQLNIYLGYHNAVPYLGKEPLFPGITYIPPKMVPATDGKFAVVFTHPLLPGLILYDLFATKIKAQKALELHASYSSNAIIMMCAAALAAVVVGGFSVAGGVGEAGGLAYAIDLIPAMSF